MSQGTVKWFNSQKGFRLIAMDGGGQDAFVHASAVERAGIGQLREGAQGHLRTGRGPRRQDVGGKAGGVGGSGPGGAFQ